MLGTRRSQTISFSMVIFFFMSENISGECRQVVNIYKLPLSLIFGIVRSTHFIVHSTVSSSFIRSESIFTACSSFPQFLPIYVNPRNDKLQAFYQASLEERTRDEFLSLLQQNSTSIVLD